MVSELQHGVKITKKKDKKHTKPQKRNATHQKVAWKHAKRKKVTFDLKWFLCDFLDCLLIQLLFFSRRQFFSHKCWQWDFLVASELGWREFLKAYHAHGQGQTLHLCGQHPSQLWIFDVVSALRQRLAQAGDRQRQWRGTGCVRWADEVVRLDGCHFSAPIWLRKWLKRQLGAFSKRRYFILSRTMTWWTLGVSSSKMMILILTIRTRLFLLCYLMRFMSSLNGPFRNTKRCVGSLHNPLDLSSQAVLQENWLGTARKRGSQDGSSDGMATEVAGCPFPPGFL